MHREVSLEEVDPVRFGAIGQALGVETFGINDFDLPPDGISRLHDEVATGQEEVYVVVSGGGHIIVGNEAVPLTAGQCVRVQPEMKRQLRAGADGLRYVAVGGATGAYEPPFGTPGLHKPKRASATKSVTVAEVPAVEVRRLRHALGVTAFGVNHFTLPPHVWHKRHDEGHTGQQELYLVLQGNGVIALGDDEVELRQGRFVLVEPTTVRQIRAGSEGLSIVAFGGVAGRGYEPPW